jgi:hypothetical protein
MVVQRTGDGEDDDDGGDEKAALGVCVRTPVTKEKSWELPQ